MDIQGKVFIVTGGASGLGEGTARMLAANGGKVVIADMQADKGEAIAKEIGGVFCQVDVTDDEQVAFTKTLGKFAPERAGGEEVISKITLNEEDSGTAAEYLKGSLYWHIDGTRNDVPILAFNFMIVLAGKVPSLLPAVGKV